MNTPTNLEQNLDHLVQQAMQTWNIPGLALVVLQDDQTVISKGYGIREMNKPELLDEHTLFAIGSNTKAFTPP